MQRRNSNQLVSNHPKIRNKNKIGILFQSACSLIFGCIRFWVIFLFFSTYVSFSFAGLIYSTFIGGSDGDYGMSIDIDNAENAYVIGRTFSLDFPTSINAIDTTYNGGNYGDIFVCKLNKTGSTLLYSTYLGGYGNDYGYGIAVDNNGDSYLTGYTDSPDFPTTPGAYNTNPPPNPGKIFVSKLNNAGTALLYSTFIGGGVGQDIAIDVNGNAYITGITTGILFPTTIDAFDTTYNGYEDVFVSKLNSTGSSLLYSTFVGGESNDWGIGIAVDKDGNAYITGYTGGYSNYSTYYPTTVGAFDTTHNGKYNVFVTKLNASGSSLIYSTLLGGSNLDYGEDIAIDTTGNAYIIGYTYSSTDFPTTVGAYDTICKGSCDVFISKLNTTGSALVYSTFLGGSNLDKGFGLTLDQIGNAYITGCTYSSNFPITKGAISATFNGGAYDGFLCKLNTDGSSLLYATFFGGNEADCGAAICRDHKNNVYVTGNTASPNFPTSHSAFDSSFNGSYDVFISKFNIKHFLNSYCQFTINSDTTYWYFEKYGDGASAGTLSWTTSYASQDGVVEIIQLPGQKGQLSQVFSVPSTGWYTAIAKVATDIVDINKQQKVYLYLQELDSDSTIRACANQVIQPGAGGFAGAGVWKDMQISFYAQETLLGVQMVGINPTNSGVTSSLFFDDIWVYAGGGQATTEVALTNPSFEAGTTGWLIEPYGNAWSSGVWEGWSGLLLGAQGPGEKAKISQLFNVPIAGQDATGSVWVYSGATTMNETQKVYLYLYSFDSGYTKVIESGNAILQPGKWIPGQWHQLQFGCLPITTYNAMQVVSINPAGYPYQAIYFDTVDLKRD